MNNKKGVLTMSSEIIVALITGLVSLSGAFIGAFASSKLTNYRLEQIEKKVEDIPSLSQRLALVEQRLNTLEQTK